MTRWSLKPRVLPYAGLLLVMAATAHAAAGGGPGGDRRDTPTPQQTEARLQLERQREAEFQAHRRTPQARQERANSRVTHRGLGRAAALALARSRFDATFSERLYPKLDDGGTRVLEYEGDFKAHVERPDGERLVVHQEGPVPLRSSVRTGEKEPVDLTLENRDGRFEPKNPVVPISISAGGDVTQPESGVGFQLAGASDFALAPVGEDRLFADNALPDTDVVFAPTAQGARIAFQVRSADAPEQATLAFDLPPGAEIRRATGAGTEPGIELPQLLEIVRAGEVVARLMPPVAWDAEGAPVEVSYELVGDDVAVKFPHRNKDLLYPLMVDPDLVYAYPSSYSWTAGSTAWAQNAYPSSLWQYATNYALVVANRVGTFYGDYYGNWQRTFGSPWMIKTAAFSGITHSGTQTMCAQVGIWLLAWDSIQTWCSAYSSSNPRSFTATVPDPQKDGGNYAMFRMVPNGPGYRSGQAVASMAYATLYVRDVVDPTMTSGAPSSAWRDITNFTTTASAQDAHIGMNRFEMWSGGIRRATSAGCNRAGTCSQTFTWSGVPEGSTAAQILAYDDHGNFATQNFTLNVDRSNPTLTLSGALYDARGSTTMAETLALRAVAADARSGAKRVDIYVDGSLVNPQGDQACSSGGCSLTRDWTFQGESYGPGEHTIRVVAADHVNRTVEQSFKVVWVPCP